MDTKTPTSSPYHWGGRGREREGFEPAERSRPDGSKANSRAISCTADHSAKGARDAAILMVFYGCGLRRGELARLDLDDFDPEDGSILVQSKRNKQRTVYLPAGGGQHLEAWLRHRGGDPGPLFCPVRQTGEIPLTKMRGEAIAYILRRRQEQAGVGPFSPHDLHRSTVTHLFAAGVDVFNVQRLAGHADSSTTAR